MKPGPRFAGLFVLAVICSLPEDFAQAAPMAAIVAKYSIDLNGNGITVDSYDSTDPAKSNNGHYDSSHYSGDMGDIASNDGIANALSIGNAKIYGRAHVGPGGTIFVGPSGAIGEHWWQASNSGIEPGWFAADANYTCPDVSFPYQASNPGVQTWTEPGDVVSTNISYVTNFVISTNFPNPLPWGGVVTNIGYFTTTTLPDPPPAGLVTNTVSTTTRTFPAPGTYVGSITTNHITSGPIQNQGYWYIFNRITSYSYPVYYFSFNLYVTNTVWATNHYDNLLIAGASYFLSSLTGSTYVAGMDVRLVVANGIDLAYPFTIPQGSAVKVWSGGTSLVLTANQSFNQSGHAGVFVIYCADSVTSITANGSAQFNGVIFAPNANLTASTGGLNAVDFCGALFVSWVNLNGHFSFHFDEALNRTPPFPLITAQPQDQTVLAGQNAIFSVSVADLGPCTYQWLFAQDSFFGPFVPIPGATNIALTLNNVNTSNLSHIFLVQSPSTPYAVVVSNPQGSVTSSVAILTVFFPPTISTQPVGQMVMPGSNATLSVGHDFISPPLSFQWRFNGVNLTTATNGSFTIAGMQPDYVGDYDVLLSNPYGSVTSQTATVSITLTPQLGGSVWSVDNQFQFSVAGVPGFNYAVQASTNLADWVSLVTNTSPFTFTDPDAPNFSQRYYRSVYVP